MSAAAPLSSAIESTEQSPIRVLIVDDSVALGQLLTRVFESVPDIEVVGHALDPYQARDMIKALDPDVLTLDVEMPRMDGLTFLRNLMRLHPMPVVMLSMLTEKGASVTLDALEAGAVDFMVKRSPGDSTCMNAYASGIVERVRNAGAMKVHPVLDNPKVPSQAPTEADVPELAVCRLRLEQTRPVSSQLRSVICLGSSTGGPDALRQMLSSLVAPDCALLLAQHMPERFMAPFAERLDRLSAHEVRIAEQGEPIVAGRGYVAPGDHHLEIGGAPGAPTCLIRDTDKVSGHRPSVDVLFNSASTTLKSSAVGVLLTGMGEDGAHGLKAMHEAGSLTLVQDQQSSAVWGMPGRAHELGAADAALPLCKLGPALGSLMQS